MQVGDGEAVGEVEQAIHFEDVGRIKVEFAQQQAAVIVRHAARHFQTHHGGETALAQFAGDHRQQIVGHFLVAADVGVAGDAEGVHAVDCHAGKEFADMAGDELFDGQQAAARRRRFFRRFDPAAGGDLEAREMGGALLRVFEDDGQGEAEVGDEGEGVAGIDGERGQDGVDFLLKSGVQHFLLPRAEVIVVADINARLRRAGRGAGFLPRWRSWCGA